MHRLLLSILLVCFSGCVDVPERADAFVVDGATADAQPMVDGAETPLDGPPEPDSDCVPDVEVCNGADDDCDGAIDESDPDACMPCVVPGGVGACTEGRRVCADGVPACRAVGAPPAAGCDLIDGDCDGRWDEAGEVPVGADPLVTATCGDIAPAWGPAADPGRCDDGRPDTVGEVGCGPVHACLDRACIDDCRAVAARTIAECAAACGGGDACRVGCWQDNVEPRRNCIATCLPAAENVERWQCTLGETGPDCQIGACIEAAVLDAGQCRPTELCNNGVDDDNDGLVDGSLVGDDPCNARFGPSGGTAIGACTPGAADCDGLAGLPFWACGATCPYTPELSYGYALDREEVSNRAYASCVAAGVCSPPSGLAWSQTRVLLDSERGVLPRPTEPECGGTVVLDPRPGSDIDPRVVDLPVAGVTWCQARTYCQWAGKRLPTEVEWERAASGVEPRRRWPWAGGPPAVCADAQCCDDGDPATPRPAQCSGGDLPICPEGEPLDEARSACMATLAVDRLDCGGADPNCPECLPSPAVTYSNIDGRSPDGVLNLIGNVAEWTFDWASIDYEGAVEFDPVGPPCSVLPGPSYRMVRGGDYLRPGLPADVLARQPLMPGARFPGVGFRCARTLVDGPDGQPIVCDPGALGDPTHEPRVPDPCPAPDFEDVRQPLASPGRPACPLGNQRIPTRDCTEGQDRLCPTDRDIDCGAFVVRSLTFDLDGLGDLFDRLRNFVPILDDPPPLDPVSSEFLTRVFEGDLVPNGGRTLIALETTADFGAQGIWPARLVNATYAAGGSMVEQGVVTGDMCAPFATQAFNITTLGQGGVDNLCVLGRGELYIAGAPARLPYSALMFYDVALSGPDLAGDLMYILTRGDAANSSLGDVRVGAISSFLDGSAIPDFDLCPLTQIAMLLDPPGDMPPEREVEALLGTWQCGAFHQWPGCQGPVCTDPSRCRGWLVPQAFTATRRDALSMAEGPECAEP